MKDVFVTDYCRVTYESADHIIYVKFIGDIADEDYKEIWRKSVDYIFNYGLEKIVIDQSEIGSVKLSARGWVVMKMYPQIKRDLSPDLVVSVISSKNASYRSGMQYLVKAVQAFSGYAIQFHPSYDEARVWLNGLRK